jgi:hypothetical protein
VQLAGARTPAVSRPPPTRPWSSAYVIRLILGFFHAFVLPHTALATENLALRQPLAVPQVSAKRPRLRKRDRIFWVWLARLWAGCTTDTCTPRNAII